MTEHTDREHQLEKKLMDTLIDVQSLIMSMQDKDMPRVARVMKRLQARVLHFHENHEWYMQHPRWNEAIEEAIEEIVPTLPDDDTETIKFTPGEHWRRTDK